LKPKTVNIRLSDGDYEWLTQNATEISSFVRGLIQEAKRKDEDRRLEDRISETDKLLNDAEKALNVSISNAWADDPELKGIINRQRRTVERLKAKLASLSTKS
jgi:hypothetical protein